MPAADFRGLMRLTIRRVGSEFHFTISGSEVDMAPSSQMAAMIAAARVWIAA